MSDSARHPEMGDAGFAGLVEAGARELSLGGNEPFLLTPPAATVSDDQGPSASARFAAGPGHALLAAGDTGVWAVVAGRVELFARQLGDAGKEVGRLHLATLPDGELLFGMPADPRLELLAVASRDARLLHLDGISFARLARQPENRARVLRWVELWVDRLLGELAPGVPPQDFERLAEGEEKRLETPPAEAHAEGARAEVALRPAKGLLWVRHLEGRSTYFGRPELPLTPQAYLTPLGAKAWLVTAAPAHLSAVSGEHLLISGALWEGLERFHELVVRLIWSTIAERELAERKRGERRRELDREAMGGAHQRLASVLGESSAVPTGPADAARDPLLLACRRIAAHLGIELSPTLPATDALLSPPRRLQRIADASRLRIRQVILRDRWWRDDNGPLLAFLPSPAGGPPRPVALLPSSVNRYELVEPVSGERRPVDAAMAESLEGQAYMMYPPLPERALGPMDLLRHAFRGGHRDLLTIVSMGAVGGVLALLVPILTGQIFGSVIPAADRSLLTQMILALAVAAIARALFQLLRGISVLRIGGRVDSNLQPALWDRLLSLPVGFFRDYSVGDLAQRASGIDSIREILVGQVSSSLLGAIFSLTSFALLFYYSVPLALIASALVLALMLVTTTLSYLQVREQRRLFQAEGKVASLVLGLIQGIGKLRVGGAESRAYARWAEGFSDQRRYAVRGQRLANLQLGFNATYGVATALCLFAMVGLSLREQMSVSDFLAFNAAFGQFQVAALALIGVFSSLLAMVPIYERLTPILHAVPEVDPSKAEVGELRGELEMSHLSFRYTEDGPLVLDDVSIRARPGEMIALVGPSGSGKSTCLRLALGFEKPLSGSIYYDGQDLGSLDLTSLRRQLGVVLQDSRLMTGDLFSNIVGSHNLALPDAWRAAELAGVAEDIRAMPMGMHTVVSESAGTFSGGQKQRVMIARAIVHRPRVLYFDEATSALDNRTQGHVARSLEGLKATRIVVAHRLSTITGADRIYVLDKGRIVEQGTYAELITAGGLFAHLAARQLA